jgi:hypothetical protein
MVHRLVVVPGCALALASLVATPSCSHRKRQPETTAPAPPEAARGVVGMTFLPVVGESKSGNDHENEVKNADTKQRRFVPPAPRTELSLPDYPPEALAAGAPPIRIVLRIVVDAEDGRVTKVEPSPTGGSGTGPFEQEFWIESERAVRRWRFTPGLMETVENGPDQDGDGEPDYTRVVEIAPVPVLYDVRFDFDREGGAAVVTTPGP